MGRVLGYQRGVRACITWLHERAASMNDPHAKAILNTAAFNLGVDKPEPGADEVERVVLEVLDTFHDGRREAKARAIADALAALRMAPQVERSWSRDGQP